MSADHVLFYKEFSDERVVELIRMLYNWRIYVRHRDDDFSYDDCWCYQSLEAAQLAFELLGRARRAHRLEQTSRERALATRRHARVRDQPAHASGTVEMSYGICTVCLAATKTATKRPMKNAPRPASFTTGFEASAQQSRPMMRTMMGTNAMSIPGAYQ